jgi:hypothetical protein
MADPNRVWNPRGVDVRIAVPLTLAVYLSDQLAGGLIRVRTLGRLATAFAANQKVKVGGERAEQEERHGDHEQNAVIQAARQPLRVGIACQRFFAVRTSLGDGGAEQRKCARRERATETGSKSWHGFHTRGKRLLDRNGMP